MRETTRAWSNRFAEGLILTMACAAPWMFGAVDAWAQYILEIGIGIVAILSAIFGPGAFQRRGLLQWTNLGLAGLVILGMTQAIPLPAKLRAVVDPSGAALHSRLIPAVPERVLGDNAPPVALSSATLSEEPGAFAQHRGAFARGVALVSKRSQSRWWDCVAPTVRVGHRGQRHSFGALCIDPGADLERQTLLVLSDLERQWLVGRRPICFP